ncbi:MAG TPA: alanine:cation symporter family protein, partial [Sandaracinaceae bacterium]
MSQPTEQRRARRVRAGMIAAVAAAFALAVAAPSRAQDGAAVEPPPAAEVPERSVLDAIDDAFGTYVVGPIAAVLFFDLVFWDNDRPDDTSLPFIVAWLVLGATFFTLRLRFINLRGLKHAVEITAGKYDDPTEKGEVTHFQALASALSATVGLGNIAGVAIAVSMGGPGAVFWMIVAGFLGMSSKFTECTLGQMYREVDAQGR